jgi:hypothetical protein
MRGRSSDPHETFLYRGIFGAGREQEKHLEE